MNEHVIVPDAPLTADAAMLALYAVDPEDHQAGRLALDAAVHLVTLELARRGESGEGACNARNA